MKKLVFCMILSSLLLISSVAFSYPFTATIDDNDYDGSENAFWGGEVVGPQKNNYLNKDVIGEGFGVDQMIITKLGDHDWTVVLSGPYFDNYQKNNHLANQFPPGDLYINSKGWSASGVAPHYAGDTFSLSEGWDYVVTNGSSGWGLYTLTDSYLDTWAPNNTQYTYRDNQAWMGGAGEKIGSATYNLSNYASGNTLTFTFNTGSYNWTDTVGFHWTMKCGNDVLEGTISTPAPPQVPEPSTLLLLGLGLTGVAVYKKFRS